MSEIVLVDDFLIQFRGLRDSKESPTVTSSRSPSNGGGRANTVLDMMDACCRPATSQAWSLIETNQHVFGHD